MIRTISSLGQIGDNSTIPYVSFFTLSILLYVSFFIRYQFFSVLGNIDSKTFWEKKSLNQEMEENHQSKTNGAGGWFWTRLISVTEKVWESDSTDASDTEETKRAAPATAKPTKSAVSNGKKEERKTPRKEESANHLAEMLKWNITSRLIKEKYHPSFFLKFGSLFNFRSRAKRISNRKPRSPRPRKARNKRRWWISSRKNNFPLLLLLLIFSTIITHIFCNYEFRFHPEQSMFHCVPYRPWSRTRVNRIRPDRLIPSDFGDHLQRSI